jgi:hypothetical protein
MASMCQTVVDLYLRKYVWVLPIDLPRKFEGRKRGCLVAVPMPAVLSFLA